MHQTLQLQQQGYRDFSIQYLKMLVINFRNSKIETHNTRIFHHNVVDRRSLIKIYMLKSTPILMPKIIPFYPKKRESNVEGIVGDLISFQDHQLLQYEAKREGLSYTDYRKMLGLYDIPMDIAIQNVRGGISAKEYLQRFNIIQSRYKTAFISMIGLSVMSLAISLMDPTPSRLEYLMNNSSLSMEEKQREEFNILGFSRT